MTRFVLHDRLAADTEPLGDLVLCRVFLMMEARFPWLILVPRKPDCREIFELEAHDRAVLMEETAHAARTLQAATSADKMNVAAIGNIVSQLHIHVVARFEGDAAWPAPVWGFGTMRRYRTGESDELVRSMSQSFGFTG